MPQNKPPKRRACAPRAPARTRPPSRGGQGGGSSLHPSDPQQAATEYQGAQEVAQRQQEGPQQRRAQDEPGEPQGPPRSGESGLNHRGSGMKPGDPVAKTGG